MADPKIRYDILANAEGEEDVARLARELDKIDASIDPAAAARAKALAQEIEGLAAKRSAVVSFVTALSNTNTASKALDDAGQALQRLERRLDGVATPTRKQSGELEKLRDAATRAQTVFTAQTETLNRARGVLEGYGINAGSVAGAQDRLTASIKTTAAQGETLVAGYRQTAQASQASAAAQAAASRTVRDGVSGIADDFRKLQAVAGLALGGTLLGGLGREVAQVADEYANLGARIKLVTGDGQAFEQAFEGVFDVAKRTSSSLEATANLFTRIAQAGKALGVSQGEALALTETINQAVQLSGASADSSKAAIVQLVQGLQSGVLRGEEFNSVMEQSPRLAKALADGLGVTTGELRKLATQGGLTTDVVIKALQGQSAALQREFQQLPPTIGRAIQSLSTEWTRYIGEADKAAGTSATAAKAISLLANNLTEVGTALKVAGQAYVAYKAFDLATVFMRQAAALQASAGAHALETRERAAATVVTAANTTATLANTAGKTANAAATTAAAVAEGKAAVASAAATAGLGTRLGLLARFGGALGLLATGAALFGDLVVSAFDKAGTAIGEGIAKLQGYRDRTVELEAAQKGEAEAARIAAQAKAEFATQAEAATNAALGLSTVAQGLVAEFTELRAKGESAGEALDKLAKKMDLGSAQGIKDAAAALDALALRGQIAGDQIATALAKALSGKDLGIFETTARAAFDETEQGARRLQAAIEAIGEEALRRAGTSVRELTTGFSEGFGTAINDVDALAAKLQQMGIKGQAAAQLLNAALDKARDAARTDKAIQAVIERLQALGKEGKLSGQQVADGLEAARKKADDLKTGVNSVAEAYRLFGIKTRAELEGVAARAKEAFDIINADPTASLAIKQEAFKKYSEAAVAANNGVASSTIKAQGEALKLGVEFDSAGKIIVKAMQGADGAIVQTKRLVNELGEEVNAAGEKINQLAAGIDGSMLKLEDAFSPAGRAARNEKMASTPVQAPPNAYGGSSGQISPPDTSPGWEFDAAGYSAMVSSYRFGGTTMARLQDFTSKQVTDRFWNKNKTLTMPAGNFGSAGSAAPGAAGSTFHTPSGGEGRVLAGGAVQVNFNFGPGRSYQVTAASVSQAEALARELEAAYKLTGGGG